MRNGEVRIFDQDFTSMYFIMRTVYIYNLLLQEYDPEAAAREAKAKLEAVCQGFFTLFLFAVMLVFTFWLQRLYVFLFCFNCTYVFKGY